jgi:hypothetical protein
MVSFDADGQHKKTDLPRVTTPIVEGRADLVITYRSSLTHFAEKIFALFTRFYGVKDPLCGLKGYSRKVYETFGRFDTVQSIGTELALSALKYGYKAEFVTIEIKDREDQSRFYKKIFRANMKILKAMCRVLWKIRAIKRSL